MEHLNVYLPKKVDNTINRFFDFTRPLFQELGYQMSFLRDFEKLPSSRNLSLIIMPYDLEAQKQVEKIISHSKGVLLFTQVGQIVDFSEFWKGPSLEISDNVFDVRSSTFDYITTSHFRAKTTEVSLFSKPREIFCHDAARIVKKDPSFKELVNYEEGPCFCVYNDQMNLIFSTNAALISKGYFNEADNLFVLFEFLKILKKEEITSAELEKIERYLFVRKPVSFQDSQIALESQNDNQIEFELDMNKLQFNNKEFSTDLNPYENFEEFYISAQIFGDSFPGELKNKLRNFKRTSNFHGALLLKNLPVDPDLCKTPLVASEVPDKKTFVSETLLTSIASFFGEPFTFYQERGENMFHNISPTEKNKDKISSESSDIFLDFHTELIFHPLMPDYLLLYCLRQDHRKEAETLVLSVNQLMPHIPPGMVSLLFQERFVTGIDYSFGSPNGLKGNGPKTSVLFGDRENPSFRCDFDLMVGGDEKSQKALDYLRKLSQKLYTSVILEPGDLLIVDNQKSLHSRTPFKARFDGTDRWLQRVLVTRDLSKATQDFGARNRIVDVKFAV